MTYIFLDESGQFQKHGTDVYFVIGSFMTTNPRYPKLKRKTVEYIGKLNLSIRYSYVHIDNIPFEYRVGEKILDSHLYVYLVAKTFEMYFPIVDRQIFITCDRRWLKGFSEEEFATIIKTYLAPFMQKDSQLVVEMVDSTSNINIQIADWIAGALATYHNIKPLGNEYWKYLKNNIAESKEFFKEDWLEKQKTQQ